MKKFSLVFLLFISCYSNAQNKAPLKKEWDARFGGTDNDCFYSGQPTRDGGYILGGWSRSGVSGDKTQPFPGTEEEYFSCIRQTRDGGYIIGGWSKSGISGDKTQSSRGAGDYWIVKTDSLGNKKWDKRFGGTAFDELTCLQQTSDGGFILGGWSDSGIGGDKTQDNWNWITMDYWIVKTDSLGNKKWDRRFGGKGYDELFCLQQTSDGGYILGGTSGSGIEGDKTQNVQGGSDYWIVKTDPFGNKKWDKRLGGTSDELLASIQQTEDGGYILMGYSTSGIDGDKTQDTIGESDYWIVKTDSLGNKQWDKDFGGINMEGELGFGIKVPGNVLLTTDGGYLITGSSYSPISGDKTENNLGAVQTWTVKTDSLGNKLWDKTIFTNRDYDQQGLAILAKDNSYVFANYTHSGIGGYKTEDTRGEFDYWLIKFRDTSGTCISESGIIFAQRDTICSGTPASLNITGYSGAIHWQSSVTHQNFQTIPGATNSTFIDIPAQTTYYRVYTGDGLCADTSSFYEIIAKPTPLAKFSYDGSGLKITFNSDSSSGDVTAYDWDFGDSTTSILPNPVHTFSRADIFHVCLTVFNGSNCSYTTCKDIKVDIGTGTTDVTEQSNWTIYPNPANQLFRISLDKHQQGTIRIYNCLGRMLYKNEINSSQTISTADLPSGNYYLTLQTDVTVEVKKLLVVH